MNSKKSHRNALLLTAMVLAMQPAFAAGQINFIEGNVSVLSTDGKLRVPGKGERIEPGDAISTGRDGEIHVHMDDNGLIALRSNTFLKVEAYKADGGADDNAVFRLLRGSFRSITGWIGKNQPEKYSVRTATATLGIRGTDHETLVIGEGPGAGTYDKVNSGETELVTPLGKLKILPGQAGFTPKAGNAAPAILPSVPADFVQTKNELKIEEGKKSLEETRDEMLEKKKKANELRGVDKDGKPRVGDLEGGRKALAAFEEFLRAFEAGDLSKIRQSMDPSMIGYLQLLNDIAKESNECKQMRVSISDTKVQSGPDLAVLNFKWEKRCLLLPLFTPKVYKGQSTVLMHLGKNGWYYSALTGDKLFHPIATKVTIVKSKPANTLAQLVMVNSFTAPNGLYASAHGLTDFPITLTDPDLAGVASVNVTLKTNATNPDTLSVTLSATSPGSSTFSTSQVNLGHAPFNLTSATCLGPVFATTLELCPVANASGVPTGASITATYTDSTTPSGVPQVVSQTILIN